MKVSLKDVLEQCRAARLLSSVTGGRWDSASAFKMAQWRGDAVLALGVRSLVPELHPNMGMAEVAKLAQLSIGNETLATLFDEQCIHVLLRPLGPNRKAKADCVEALLWELHTTAEDPQGDEIVLMGAGYRRRLAKNAQQRIWKDQGE